MYTLAIDTETELITPRVKCPRLVCVSCASDMSEGLYKWDEPSTPRVLRMALTDPNIMLVGHQVDYDMAVLANAYPDLLPLIFQAYDADRITDTKLRQKLLDISAGRINQKYSLQALADRVLGVHLEKEDTWRLRYGELRDVPLEQWPQDASAYAITDATTTLKVYQAQEVGLAWLADQYRQARHAFWLHLMSVWGIKTDLVKVAALEAALTDQVGAIQADLQQAGLLRRDGTRDTAVAKARMAQAGSTRLTPKGALSLDDDACRASGDALLVQYAEYTHLTGLLNKDIAALKQGEIHTSVNSLLETGRISCGGNAENGGYNITNPARVGGVRECFVSRTGKFANADFEGLELRTMAQVCLHLLGESKMAEALNAGLDPHLMLAARLVPDVDPNNSDYFEKMAARYEAGDLTVKEARQFAKIGNFGFAGGMGAETFVDFAASNGVQLDEAKAREIKDAWLRTFPEFVRYFQRAAAMTQAGPCQIEQLYSGRFRGIPYIKRSDGYLDKGYSRVCNGYFQGLGADAAKAAGWALTKACYLPGSVLYGSRVVAFIHDEFLVEVPEAVAEACAAEVGRIMVAEANKWLPDVPARTTPRLTDCWQKG